MKTRFCYPDFQVLGFPVRSLGLFREHHIFSLGSVSWCSLGITILEILYQYWINDGFLLRNNVDATFFSLQIRGTLKSWTKLWCVLKPGVLLIYKTPKIGQWVGTILLHSCELIERPSKKDGFCFKLFHPLDQSIWAVKVTILMSQTTSSWLPKFLSTGIA